MILAGLGAALYALNRIILIPTFPDIPFLSRYVSDLLALPVYLPLSIYLARRLRIISNDFKISQLQVVGAVIIFSFLFEGLIPIFDTNSLRDEYDILAYLGGGTIVYTVSSIGKEETTTTNNLE